MDLHKGKNSNREPTEHEKCKLTTSTDSAVLIIGVLHTDVSIPRTMSSTGILKQ